MTLQEIEIEIERIYGKYEFNENTEGYEYYNNLINREISIVEEIEKNNKTKEEVLNIPKLNLELKEIQFDLKPFIERTTMSKSDKVIVDDLIEQKDKLIDDKYKNIDIDNLSDEEYAKFLILSDFKVFLTIAFKELMNVKPTPLQLEIADFLQSNHRFKLIKGYRGLGKTFISSSYIVYRLLRDLNYTVLIVSASQEYAIEVGRWVRNIIGSLSFTKHLIPSSDLLDSAKQFTVPGRTIKNKVPSVKMGSIIGGITGSRAFEILSDDSEGSSNSDSQLKRDNLKSKVKELESILMPSGRLTYLGTPHSSLSLYNDLEKNGYKTRVWTALYPKKEDLRKYNGTLAPSIIKIVLEQPEKIGTATNPLMHDTKDLMGRMARAGKSYFTLQFMLDTTLADSNRYPLKTSDLIIFDCNIDKAPLTMNWGNNDNLLLDIKNEGLNEDRYFAPFFVDNDYREYEMSVMSIDPSGRGGDVTGITIAKYINGFIYILKVEGLPGGYTPEILLRISKLAKIYKVNKIITEENFGGGMFATLLQGVLNRIYPVEVEDVWNNKQKELRIIDTIEPALNSHKIIFDKQLILDDNEIEDRNHSLIYQMTRIEKVRDCLIHDDRLDSLSMAIAYFTENMGVDEGQFVKEFKDQKYKELWDKLLGITEEEQFDEFSNAYNSIR